MISYRPSPDSIRFLAKPNGVEPPTLFSQCSVIEYLNVGLTATVRVRNTPNPHEQRYMRRPAATTFLRLPVVISASYHRFQ